MATTPTPPTIPGATRRPAPRNSSNMAIVVGVVIAIVLVIAIVIGFNSCGGSSKTPAAGSTGAKAKAATLLSTALKEISSGNLDGAKSDLQQAAKLDPQNKFAAYNLGYIAQTQGDKATAETEYRAAVALDPNFDSALYNLAIIRVSDSDVPGAITLYRQAIAANPNNANAHFNLGLLLRQTGKTSEGNQQVQAAVRISPQLQTAAKAQGVPTAK